MADITLENVLPLALELSSAERAQLAAVLTAQSTTGQTEISTPEEAARALDRLRADIGPIDVPVSELIDERLSSVLLVIFGR